MEVFVDASGHVTCRHAMDARKMDREILLEKLLLEVLKKWKYDSDQGDGFDDDGYRLYNIAIRAAQNCD